MKRAQLVGVGIALCAGAFAFIGMQSFVNRAPQTVVKRQTIGAVEILVAGVPLQLGAVAQASNFRWRKWPKDAVHEGLILRTARPNAVRELAGGVARTEILKDEPITKSKLVASGSGGVLAAILPKGMRAISTKITEITAAGRLILPNDHVDVLLTKSTRDRAGNESFVADTIFRNVRVLAIGKQLDVKDKEKGADGNVATLELTPRQAELLALANSMGKISLSLRSIADINTNVGDGASEGLKKREQGTAIRLLKYGVKGRAYGLN